MGRSYPDRHSFSTHAAHLPYSAWKRAAICVRRSVFAKSWAVGSAQRTAMPGTSAVLRASVTSAVVCRTDARKRKEGDSLCRTTPGVAHPCVPFQTR